MDLYSIYKKLNSVYGPQRWWPLYVVDPDLEQYSLQHNLTYGISYERLKKFKTEFRDPYFEIALGAILTQNVSWVNVAQAIKSLHKARALTPDKIVSLPTKKLEKILVPTRYYSQKTKKVQLFSKWLIKEYDGDILEISKIELQKIRAGLLNQWGVGKETADSIMLYALNLPVFMIDIYTKRLCEKFSIVHDNYDTYKNFFETKLTHTVSGMTKAQFYQEYHALIVRSGQDKHVHV